MKKYLVLGVILITSILFCEILLNLIFYSPLRLYYPLSKEKRDIQTDFDVTYNVNWRTGNRIIKCNNNNLQNKKVIFVGDSFVFGQGLKEEDTFVNLYACKTGYNVKNLGTVGIGLRHYREIILNHDLQNVELIYLIFYDNDLDFKEEKNFLSKIKNFLRYKSFVYLILRKLKNHIFYGIIQGDNAITYKGFWNNPASVFKNDPYKLKKDFEIDEYKRSYIEKEILKIGRYIKKNSDAKLITMVIPDPSVVSVQHVNFFKSVGALYFPKFLEVSELAKIISFLSKKYDFEYLPLYENLIETYTKKNVEYYFDTDFHFNKQGSIEVFNYIISMNAH